MPLPFCETAFLPPANPDDICAVLRRSLQLHEFVKLMVKYMFDCSENNLPAKDFALEVSAHAFVPGMMIPYRTKTRTYSEAAEEVKGIWGPPDDLGISWWVLDESMKGRFPIGASDDYQPETALGDKEVTLTVAQMPKHDHEMIFPQAMSTIANPGAGRFIYTPKNAVGVSNGGKGGVGGNDADVDAFPQVEVGKEVGGGEPHTNIPPFVAVVWIRRTDRMEA